MSVSESICMCVCVCVWLTFVRRHAVSPVDVSRVTLAPTVATTSAGCSFTTSDISGRAAHAQTAPRCDL